MASYIGATLGGHHPEEMNGNGSHPPKVLPQKAAQE
jgi:hypothetical protein